MRQSCVNKFMRQGCVFVSCHIQQVESAVRKHFLFDGQQFEKHGIFDERYPGSPANELVSCYQRKVFVLIMLFNNGSASKKIKNVNGKRVKMSILE